MHPPALAPVCWDAIVAPACCVRRPRPRAGSHGQRLADKHLNQHLKSMQSEVQRCRSCCAKACALLWRQVRSQPRACHQSALGEHWLLHQEMMRLQYLRLSIVSISRTLHAGPRGFFRSVQAAGAVGSLVQEVLLSGAPLDPPQVLLRKLFERLGATYIKLGQFIASSPSLFPEGAHACAEAKLVVCGLEQASHACTLDSSAADN